MLAFVHIEVTQGHLDEVGDALAAVPEIIEAFSITGGGDLLDPGRGPRQRPPGGRDPGADQPAGRGPHPHRGGAARTGPAPAAAAGRVDRAGGTEVTARGADLAARGTFAVMKAIAGPAGRAVFGERVAGLRERGKAVNAAAAFGIDAAIDPAGSRDWILATMNGRCPVPRPGHRPFIDAR